MSDHKHLIFPLVHVTSRARAAMAVNAVPDGWVLEIRPPNQSEQPEMVNVSTQLDWLNIPIPLLLAMNGCPMCFDSREDFERWQHEAKVADWGERRFCRDCNPDRRNMMIRDDRCAYPETVFVVLRGEGMVGLRRDDPGWFGAVTGKYLGSGKRAATEVIVPAGREAFEGSEKRET